MGGGGETKKWERESLAREEETGYYLQVNQRAKKSEEDRVRGGNSR